MIQHGVGYKYWKLYVQMRRLLLYMHAKKLRLTHKNYNSHH